MTFSRPRPLESSRSKVCSRRCRSIPFAGRSPRRLSPPRLPLRLRAMPKPCVLTIAGSDSGGGAGIQADLKAIAAFGVHGASAIAAITAQNSREVTGVFPLPNSIVEAQIDAVMSDLNPAVIKLGMLGTAELVELVARKLEQWKPQAIVLDPVMIAGSGARLLEENAVDAVRERLVPLATIV